MTITHETVGRINVERGENSVTLKLWAWSQKADATLSVDEAKLLIRKIEAALAPPKKRAATAPVVEEDEDDFSDIA